MCHGWLNGIWTVILSKINRSMSVILAHVWKSVFVPWVRKCTFWNEFRSLWSSILEDVVIIQTKPSVLAVLLLLSYLGTTRTSIHSIHYAKFSTEYFAIAIEQISALFQLNPSLVLKLLLIDDARVNYIPQKRVWHLFAINLYFDLCCTTRSQTKHMI